MCAPPPSFPQYQGGSSFPVFTAQGSNPAFNCKIFGKSVHKVYDKLVRGYVYNCLGGMSSKIQLPKDEKTGLQLVQPYLVLQIFVPKGQHFSLELRAADTQGTRRKMYFSTSFSELKANPLHCQIPLSMGDFGDHVSSSFRNNGLNEGALQVEESHMAQSEVQQFPTEALVSPTKTNLFPNATAQSNPYGIANVPAEGPASSKSPESNISTSATRNVNEIKPANLDSKKPMPSRLEDKELDLLYDPILDCYYDPKTNRYYELK